jgi:hypothetical protein
MNNDMIIEKAKRTIYKHKHWYIEGNKTVYDAIKEMVETKDFFIDLKPKSYRNPSLIDLKFASGWHSLSDVRNFCIENGLYQHLIFRYSGSEGGSDKGNLKIKTFLILKGLI